MHVIFFPGRRQLIFGLPGSFQKGEVTFYRPSDRRQDVRVTLASGGQRERIVSTAGFPRGYWKVQLNWSDGNLEYYTEKNLVIP